MKVQLKDVETRLKQRKLAIEFSDKAIDWIAKRGYDPIYGARPLKRVIQSELLNPLSTDIISGKFKSGDKIKVDLDGTKLKLSN